MIKYIHLPSGWIVKVDGLQLVAPPRDIEGPDNKTRFIITLAYESTPSLNLAYDDLQELEQDVESLLTQLNG